MLIADDVVVMLLTMRQTDLYVKVMRNGVTKSKRRYISFMLYTYTI